MPFLSPTAVHSHDFIHNAAVRAPGMAAADGVGCQRRGMTKHRPDFELNRPGTLIAALPAVLGFVPEKSLVLVSVDRGELGAVMRVDL